MRSHDVRLSIAARADQDRLNDFLAEKSPSAARRANRAIAEAILSLRTMPERGYPSRRIGWRELVVRFGRDGYVIRYRVEPGAVFVARIFHGLEDR
jgi:plasmid stabilization system protein ParE